MSALYLLDGNNGEQEYKSYSIQQDKPFGENLIQTGLLVIFIFLMGLGFWSFFAPIESAVIANGVLHVDSNRKTVQHLTGGIVRAILVREGDVVKPGDVLIKLEDTLLVSKRNLLMAEYIEAVASISRLIAERDGKLSIDFPDELITAELGDGIENALNSQRNIFNSQQKFLSEQLLAHQQRQAARELEIQAIQSQITSGQKQVLLSQELIQLSASRAEYKNDPSKMLQLELNQSRIQSEHNKMRISLARAQQMKLDENLKISESDLYRNKQIEQELIALNAQVYALQQQLAVAEDSLQRMQIKATTQGEVVGLNVHTIGGVINAGERLLDIVPSNDDLIVKTSIDLQDIDQVRSGMSVLVELTSLNHRFQRPIHGKIKWVSADSLLDEASGRGYYEARIELDPESVQQQEISLYPGMGAEVMIRTGASTPIEYLVKPISRSFGHALREK